MDDLDLAATAVMWSVMSDEEKLGALEEIINDELADMGYDEAEVEAGDLDGNLGETSNGTITLDTDSTLFEDPFSEALNTAYHEAAHVMDDQDDIDELMTEEQLEDFNAVNPDEETDHTTADPLHQNVEDYAEAMVDETKKRIAPILEGGGGSGPAGAVGAGGSNAGDSGEDFSFEIDYANVTVTDASADDSGADFDFEIDTANVEVSP